MTPGARIAAAAALLDLIDTGRRPAERLVRDWFRERRYAGSGDRRAVGEQVFGVLRRRGMLDWRLNQTGLPCTNVLRVILDAMIEGDAGAVAGSLDDAHGPGRLDPLVLERLDRAARLDLSAAPDPVRGNYPAFLDAALRSVFGDGCVTEMAALSAEMAAVDLRVNLARTDRAGVIERLAADGIIARPFGWTPATLRLGGRPRIDDHPLVRDGLVEVQDAASQLVARLAGARPGMQVADLCAGAGGKTLAMAVEMRGRGQIHALDIDARRLEQLKLRARRAGLSIVQPRRIDPDGAPPADLAGRMDCVLADAPCTGTGTWRRQPELRWRLSAAMVADHAGRQGAILDRAVSLLRPGGQLVYATCSILPDENETVVTDLLARHSGLEPVPVAAILAESGVDGAAALSTPAGHLRLSPLSHGTDGFFAAVFQAPLR